MCCAINIFIDSTYEISIISGYGIVNNVQFVWVLSGGGLIDFCFLAILICSAKTIFDIVWYGIEPDINHSVLFCCGQSQDRFFLLNYCKLLLKSDTSI